MIQNKINTRRLYPKKNNTGEFGTISLKHGGVICILPGLVILQESYNLEVKCMLLCTHKYKKAVSIGSCFNSLSYQQLVFNWWIRGVTIIRSGSRIVPVDLELHSSLKQLILYHFHAFALVFCFNIPHLWEREKSNCNGIKLQFRHDFFFKVIYLQCVIWWRYSLSFVMYQACSDKLEREKIINT